MENMDLLIETLYKHNSHEMDKNIEFEEESHKYTIKIDPDTKYTSVTTWVHSHFEKFDSDKIIKKMMEGKNWKEGHKYWGMTPEEIKNSWSSNGNSVASLGTNLHYNIECFMNNPNLEKGYKHSDILNYYIENAVKEDEKRSKEWQYFINYIVDHPHLKPYRTEWTVYNIDNKIAGSIDMVYENDDGSLSIYDWKRCQNISPINNFNKYSINPVISEMPDSNFWHYALQLNMYKNILETKYGKKVKELKLVRLHPTSDNYELIDLPDLSEEINKLLGLGVK